MLVALPPDVCPDCGSTLDVEIVEEPTLFIGCGYGATRQTVVRYCRCRWELVASRGEVWP